jgi:pyrroline-5-carboxylate reductase
MTHTARTSTLDRLTIDGHLLIAGAGNMGAALIAGWLERGLDPTRIIVQDPLPPPQVAELLARYAIRIEPRLAALDAPPALMVLAVKPQVFDDVLGPLAHLAGPATVVLSIAAGRTIAGIERHCARGTAVVRSMPNTPASIGRGITVAVANAYVTPAQRATCDALLRAVGEVAWSDREDVLDAVTAVSGSGPAYVFYLTECLTEAAVSAGLEPALARRLARSTVAGAGELLYRSPLDAAVLRQNVTSPNGTTHAALQVLMADGGLGPLLREAVAAATRRSRELAT